MAEFINNANIVGVLTASYNPKQYTTSLKVQYIHTKNSEYPIVNIILQFVQEAEFRNVLTLLPMEEIISKCTQLVSSISHLNCQDPLNLIIFFSFSTTLFSSVVRVRSSMARLRKLTEDTARTAQLK